MAQMIRLAVAFRLMERASAAMQTGAPRSGSGPSSGTVPGQWCDGTVGELGQAATMPAAMTPTRAESGPTEEGVCPACRAADSGFR